MKFFETFWIAPKGPLSFVSIFCNTMDVKKLQRVPPFTFFDTVTLFKNLILKNFLGNFFMSPKGPPSIFFSFFATSWSFTKPEGPPSSILSLRYGADFGRSRLVQTKRVTSSTVRYKLKDQMFLFTGFLLDFDKKLHHFS